MPARAAAVALPDITGVRPLIPWWEVDRLQGVQSMRQNPAKVLLDLWPVFRANGAVTGSWSGAEPPVAVLTHCWRVLVASQGSGPSAPELEIQESEAGHVVRVKIDMAEGLPDAMTLWWVDLRHLPRLRARSRGLWDYASDGLALLLACEPDTFEAHSEWFAEYWAEYEGEERALDIQEEARQLAEEATRILGEIRARARREDMAERFARRVRRAAVAPAWGEWGESVLAAVRNVGPLWDLMDKELVHPGDWDGDYYTSLFSMSWLSPEFYEFSVQMFNDVVNNGSGLLMPSLSAVASGSTPDVLTALREQAGVRAAGLRALADALAGFNELAEQACGVIDDNTE